MAEKLLWNEMFKREHSRDLGCRGWRVEPGMPTGISDVFWCSDTGRHRSGWVELKWEVKETRPEQGIWLRNIWDAGGSAFIYAKWQGGHWLVPGWAVDLEAQIRYESHLAFWEDEVDWQEFWNVVRCYPC